MNLTSTASTFLHSKKKNADYMLLLEIFLIFQYFINSRLARSLQKLNNEISYKL